MTSRNKERAAAPSPDGAAADEDSFHSPLLIGPRVRALRRLKHLTVDELAQAIGVDKAHVSRIERGHYPSLQLSRTLEDHLEDIQRALQDAAAASDGRSKMATPEALWPAGTR